MMPFHIIFRTLFNNKKMQGHYALSRQYPTQTFAASDLEKLQEKNGERSKKETRHPVEAKNDLRR